MKIKLNKIQLKYLLNELLSEETNISFFIEIDEKKADMIRDLAGQKLQSVGFDENYELTKEGKVLEDLIDLFYNR